MAKQPTPPGERPASPPARREAGSGSIFQRARDGKWIAVLEWPSDGRRIRKTRACATERAAKAALKELQAEYAAGRPAPDRHATLGAFLEEWYATTAPRLAPNTAAHWRGALDHHIIPELGRARLADLGPPQVQQWLTRLDAKGLGPWARIKAHAVLRAALNDALRWKRVTLNAAALVKAPPLPTRAPVILTPDQARDLLARVGGTAMEAILHLALYGALRQGEILALRWRDVGLTAGIVTVSATLTRGKDRHRAPPKTERSRRRVPLAAPTLTALRAHRQREQRAGRFPAADAFLFVEPRTGAPLGAGKLGVAWRDLLAGAGLPPMHFHDLRHCALSYMHAAGVPVGTIQAIAGHASPLTTLGVYVNPQPAELRGAVEAVARLLAPDGDKEAKQNS